LVTGEGVERCGDTKVAAEKPPRSKAVKGARGSAGNRKQGGHLPAARQAARDARIVALRIDGRRWSEIAADPAVELSVSACRDVYRSYLNDPERGQVVEHARETIVEAALKLGRFEERMGELYAREVERSGERTSNLIGLTRMQAEMVAKRVALLQASAILPQEIGMLRHLDDLRALLATIARVLDEEGVPTRVWERLASEVPFAPDPV